MTLWQELHVKHIQLDTLSHLVLHAGIRLFAYENITTLFEEIIQFHNDYHVRDVR